MLANEAYIPHRFERLTWEEICARYPDEWVVLVEFERYDDTDLRFHAAVVIAHHKTRKAASPDVKAAFLRYDEAGSFFTGRLMPPEVDRLAM
ncbi:MAG: hypothetical protein E6J90_30320 [Deltaproteobacteria bacterium]|nr:MAG: hypothetical protein E6J90_30320 [Deltaproteobacteria bacterium]TMQ19920.1 MAG: hypothetical protein E6J91_05100 [Deltaproteobacteria bacterium]